MRQLGEGRREWLRAIETPSFDVVESPSVEASSEVLARLRFNLPIEDIADTFNDKLSYDCAGYDDLVRMATGMRPIVAKYRLFGEAPDVNGILRSFLANYERVHAGLEEAHRAIQDPPSRRADIKARLEEANRALTAAHALGGSFYRPDPFGPIQAPIPPLLPPAGLLCPWCRQPDLRVCGHLANWQAQQPNQPQGRICACMRANLKPGASKCDRCASQAMLVPACAFDGDD